jgi:ZIP family zinc transporter
VANAVAEAALYTLVPVGATIVGGAVASLRRPGPRVTSAVQHTAAGVVLAAVAVEVIPDVKANSPAATILGFAVGVPLMLALRALARRLGGEEQPAGSGGIRVAAGLLGTTALDLLVDGIVLGAGFAAGSRQGILLAVALTLELLFLGLSTAVTLAVVGTAPRTVAAVTGGLAMLPLAGAVGGAAVLGSVSATTLAGVLAFGSVALMYLVVEELLVEAHEVEETPWAISLFFLGFLVYLVISELAG